MSKNPALEAYKRTKQTQASKPHSTDDEDTCKACGYTSTQDVTLADGREATYCMNCRVTMPLVPTPKN